MRKIILILLFIFICSINTVMAEEKTPILHYSFDIQDTEESEGGYIIKDLSGNGYDTNCNSSDILSKFESGISLFGTVNAVKNECFDASSSILSLPFDAFKDVEDFTMNFWFSQSSAWQTIFSAGSAPNNITLTGWTGSGMIRLMSYCENGSAIYSILPDFTNQDIYSKMHMYTITKSGSQIAVYFDGELEEAKYATNRASTLSFSDIADSFTDAEFCYMSNGYIDEFRFYNEALSANEIKQIFDEENPMTVTEVEVIGEYADKINIVKEESAQKLVFNITTISGDTIDISKINLLIAEYDDKGWLKDIKTLSFGEIMGSVTTSTDLPKSANYKIFIWDDNQSPLINVITSN